MTKSVVVITPTTGDSKLTDALASVDTQTYPNVRHLVVVDGPEYGLELRKNHGYSFSKYKNTELLYLNQNTGAGGFYGHRVFAGVSHLVNEDYVFFLDQDNWYTEDHIQELVNVLEQKQLHMAYSLRSVHDSNKNFICNDDCESLGIYPVWNDANSFHIDTSAYAFNRLFLIQVSQLWHFGYGGDRRFFNIVRTNVPNIKFDTSGKYTLCYRLGSTLTSASPDFFTTGNEEMRKKHAHSLEVDNTFPWNR